MIDNIRCVVLNSTYEPISIVSAKRALILYFEEKAVIVEEHPEKKIHSVNGAFPIPITIALKRFIKDRRVFRSAAILTQRNLFIRDGYTCQYCGRPRSKLNEKEFLTRDHVVPECKGGKSTWTNLITCCNTCNNKKGDRDLSNTGLKILKTPTAPTIFEIWSKAHKRRHTD